MGVNTQSTRRVVVPTTHMVLLASTVELEPPPLHGTQIFITPLRNILVMGRNKQSGQWRELDEYST
jgi:hypothetical protein